MSNFFLKISVLTLLSSLNVSILYSQFDLKSNKNTLFNYTPPSGDEPHYKFLVLSTDFGVMLRPDLQINKSTPFPMNKEHISFPYFGHFILYYQKRTSRFRYSTWGIGVSYRYFNEYYESNEVATLRDSDISSQTLNTNNTVSLKNHYIGLNFYYAPYEKLLGLFFMDTKLSVEYLVHGNFESTVVLDESIADVDENRLGGYKFSTEQNKLILSQNMPNGATGWLITLTEQFYLFHKTFNINYTDLGSNWISVRVWAKLGLMASSMYSPTIHITPTASINIETICPLDWHSDFW